MRNFSKLLGIIALAAVIGFSFTACSDGGDSGGGGGTKGGLTAPTGFTATAYSSSSIILTWNAVPGAIGYNIYNGTSRANLNGVGTVTSNYANNYNLPANTTVYYQIAAYNEKGEGPRSKVISATTLSANNYSPNGVWEGYEGTQINVSGSTGVYKAFGGDFSGGFPLFTDAKNKGYIKIGDQLWRNISSTGNLSWSGQELNVTYNTASPNVATGTSWSNITFTMSADGQTLTVNNGSFSVIWRRK
jgi:uncharacterized protein (DUF2147 family)